MVSRALAVDIPFALAMSFELPGGTVQLEGEIEAPGKQPRGNKIGIRPNAAALSASSTVNAIRTGPDLNYAACRSCGPNRNKPMRAPRGGHHIISVGI